MKKTDVVEMNASKKRQLLTMSVDNWIAVTDCPVQRDTADMPKKQKETPQDSLKNAVTGDCRQA